LFVSYAFDLSNPNKTTTQKNKNLEKNEEEITRIGSLPGCTMGQEALTVSVGLG